MSQQIVKTDITDLLTLKFINSQGEKRIIARAANRFMCLYCQWEQRVVLNEKQRYIIEEIHDLDCKYLKKSK